MRLPTIVAACLLFASSAQAQYARADSTTAFQSETMVVVDSVRPAPVLVIHYPVAKHAAFGTLTGGAVIGSLAGIFSVVCSSPSCPRLGPAITYGAGFGVLVGAAMGAVSGVNSPVRLPRSQ